MDKRLQKFRCSNAYNEYSNQLYPTYIRKVEYLNDISAKYPGGIITIGCNTVDGYWVSGFLKARKSSSGYYAIFGGYRLYVGYCGAVQLLGVPGEVQAGIRDMVEAAGGRIG